MTAHAQRYMVSVYAIAHFAVDFACAFLMFRAISLTPDWYLYLLVYNFCAFALQLPFGVIADKINKNHLLALTGCVLVAAAYGLGQAPLAAVLAAGVGNALFHIGGGVAVLNIANGKAGVLGIFVSPGALGIYFGTLLGRGTAALSFAVVVALLAMAGLIFGSFNKFVIARSEATKQSSGKILTCFHGIVLSAACFLTVVVLRSYVGLTLDFPWKGSGSWGVILVAGVVLGKAAGGFVSDRFGAAKTACLSLGLATALLFASSIPLAGVLAIFLFNMTMPITLWAMARIFPWAPGFAFGLLSFGLFLGFVPVYLGAVLPSEAVWPFAVAMVVSLLLLLVGLRKAKKLLPASTIPTKDLTEGAK